MPEEMSEKRLDGIKKRYTFSTDYSVLIGIIDELIAEVERLKEHNIVLAHAFEKASKP